MSKRCIARSSQCLSTHDNDVGQRVFLRAAGVVSGCCNDDRFLKESAHIFTCCIFLKKEGFFFFSLFSF